MREAGVTQPRRGAAAATAAVALAALVAGAGAALAPPKLVLALTFALAIVALVALHPPSGAYLLLGLTPLLAGLDRGTLLPLLRPHEGLALLVVTGFAVHVVVRAWEREPIQLRLRFGPIDRAILLLAVSSSVVPLILMVIRDRPIEQDDILYTLQLWKYYAVFLIVRGCVITTEQVRNCLWVILGAGAVVALVGIMQVLHVPFVEGQVTQLYVAEDTNEPLERGTSTLASSIAVADVMVFSLAVAFGLLLQGSRRRIMLCCLLALYVFGVLAAGQFSGIIALVVGLLAFGWISGRLSFTFVALAPVVAVAGLVLRPVIEKRLSGFQGGTLPRSWQVRLDNVTTHFWPVLERDYNWLTGVRPLARIDGPAFSGIDFIWIESGHVYLLWTGGIAFLLAFLWYMWVAIRTMARLARERTDEIGVAATAAYTALVVTAVLMVLDPHLTLRGSADLCFGLLALALVRPER